MTARTYRFRLLNVFTDDGPFTGNPLAVFEDGRGLADDEMQAIALQFNLSETTFILPSETATARVRIFSPSFEMPFAGHPTLGTAHVVRSLRGIGDEVHLEMRAGTIPVHARDDVWTLQPHAPKTRPPAASRAELGAMLGLEADDVGDAPLWVDTGSEQLVVPLRTAAAVARCRPDAVLLARHGANATRTGLAYAWAHAGEGEVLARFFFLKHGALVEDPGTGSACANLGGWHVATKAPRPVALRIRQGEHTGRRCRLHLRVDEEGRIFVTGAVRELARGELTL